MDICHTENGKNQPSILAARIWVSRSGRWGGRLTTRSGLPWYQSFEARTRVRGHSAGASIEALDHPVGPGCVGANQPLLDPQRRAQSVKLVACPWVPASWRSGQGYRPEREPSGYRVHARPPAAHPGATGSCTAGVGTESVRAAISARMAGVTRALLCRPVTMAIRQWALAVAQSRPAKPRRPRTAFDTKRRSKSSNAFALSPSTGSGQACRNAAPGFGKLSLNGSCSLNANRYDIHPIVRDAKSKYTGWIVCLFLVALFSANNNMKKPRIKPVLTVIWVFLGKGQVA
jgi:hypothetical protein